VPDFTVAPDGRVLVVGRAGSGKSTLARAMTAGYRNVVIIDPKHEESLAGGRVVYEPRAFAQLYPQRSTRIVFRPDAGLERAPDVDEVYARVLRFGNTAIVNHEVMFYATSAWCLPNLRRAQIAGRSRQVPLWNLTQRPVDVHNVILSETTHAFVFELLLESDRRKVAGIVGPGALEPPGRPFAFGYYGPSTGGGLVRCDPLEVPNDPADAEQSGDRHGAGDRRHLHHEGRHADLPRAGPVRRRGRDLAAGS
jgi:energy-coupling factor transporter ATP-binding protein EcfA2